MYAPNGIEAIVQVFDFRQKKEVKKHYKKIEPQKRP